MAEEFGQVPGEVVTPRHQAQAETSGETPTSGLVSKARRGAMGLIDKAGNLASEQASHQARRVSAGLRFAGERLVIVADRSQQSGVMPDAARRVSRFTHRGADWIDSRGPRILLAKIRVYARRSPTTFLSLAIASGLVLGRAKRKISGSRNQVCGKESRS